MAYGVAAESFSNIPALKSAGFIDMHQVIHGGGQQPDTSFVTACKSAGCSPILNNGNDGGPGWNGSSSYYPPLASAGYMAAGGESEQNDEDQSIMASLIFMNYGGEGAGSGNDNIFPSPCSAVTGHGCASYLETYLVGAVWMDTGEITTAAVSSKNAGCKEVGILIGAYMSPNYGMGSVSYYEALANQFESAGVTCAGFLLWSGYGSDGNSSLTEGSNASIMSGLMAIWPPNMTTIDKRFGGVGPSPTPPKPGPTPSVTPNINICVNVKESQPGFQ